MESELKYIKSLKKAWTNKTNIFKDVHKQQQDSCHYFCNWLGVLDKPVIVDDSNDNAIAKWVAANLDIIPFVDSPSNKQTFGPEEVAK